MTELQKIGIFGGLFNPPHIGHLQLAKLAKEQLNLDQILWIPSNVPPHKELGAHSPSAEDRLRMVESITGQTAGFEACDIEIKRKGTSYTIDTLNEIRSERSLDADCEIYFLIGSDALALLPTWKDAENVKKNAKFAVFGRSGESAVIPEGVDVVELQGSILDTASSELRSRLLKCESIQGEVPDSVLNLIQEEAFYGAPISDGLAEHIQEVEDSAVHLATRWGVSPAPARLAARYHDAYRTLGAEDARMILEAAGEKVDEIESRNPILLHGRVAALRLERNGTGTGINKKESVDVTNAIRYHTTGRREMSEIEQILFVADRIRKNWSDVADIPADRTTAVRDAMVAKLAFLSSNDIEVHPRTSEAAEWLGVS
ncbi:MAG: nicotinate (nicotinamide) nucleotide adenylyltransferase [Candidatus Lindowbacteria bacterium]|nr:nicotinate (nicotinamide) nucleotide adenylyltransferase [Candidatus Lindowbacteria bacterium]